MILTDTGPLVALLDKNDPHHKACLETLLRLPLGPLLTTWPCFTEAMYLLGEIGGYRYQGALWDLRRQGRLALHTLAAAELDRMAALMDKYQDRPMDLADASLVTAAETLGARVVFTLDRDFHIYRLLNGAALEIVP